MTAVGHREIFAKYLHQIDCFRDTAQQPVQVWWRYRILIKQQINVSNVSIFNITAVTHLITFDLDYNIISTSLRQSAYTPNSVKIGCLFGKIIMIHFSHIFSRTVALMLHCCVHRLSSVCRLYGMYCG